MSRFAAVVIFIIFSLSCFIINGQSPEDVENKCGGCPCNNPCTVPSSPPPPPSPSPPPPVLPPPSSPPPPKKPSTSYCPPPPNMIPSGSGGGGGPVFPTPPSQYIYFTGPPGNLYPVDQNFSRAARQFNGGIWLILIGAMLLALW